MSTESKSESRNMNHPVNNAKHIYQTTHTWGLKVFRIQKQLLPLLEDYLKSVQMFSKLKTNKAAHVNYKNLYIQVYKQLGDYRAVLQEMVTACSTLMCKGTKGASIHRPLLSVLPSARYTYSCDVCSQIAEVLQLVDEECQTLEPAFFFAKPLGPQSPDEEFNAAIFIDIAKMGMFAHENCIRVMSFFCYAYHALRAGDFEAFDKLYKNKMRYFFNISKNII
jgi:hypothetical protein